MRTRTTAFMFIALLWLLSSASQAQDTVESQPEVLTLDEAAELLRVDAATIALMATAGTLPARRVRLEDGSDTYRFARDALLAWLRRASDRDGPKDVPVLVGDTLSALGDASEQPTSTDVFLRTQSVLSPAGDLSFDLGTFYSRQDAEVLINDENPRLETVTSRGGIVQGVLRYSRSDRTEVFARGSVEALDSRVRLNEGYRSLDGESARTSLAVGMRRVVLDEDASRPETVLGLEARLPTGTSSAGLGASASVVRNVDPAVLFGSFTYSFVDGERFDDVTLLEASHTVRIDVGYALAMNDRFSLNVSMEAGYRFRTRFSDIVLPDDDFAGLQFGTTVKVSPTLYLQPVVGFSLNGTGSAYTFGLSIPFGQNTRG